MRSAERALAVCALLLLPGTATARSYELRYGLESGQTWHAVQTLYRETTVAGRTRTERGTAHFRYDVTEGPAPGEQRLDARMLSQSMGDERSPFDFSAIRFLAQSNARGTLRGMHFQLGEAEPPPLPGVEPDPVAFRQMLRSVAAAWITAVYWLPELPEQSIALGEAFVLHDAGDVGGSDPGVAMQIESKTTYTLRKVTGSLAEFAIEVHSTVDAATAQSGIVSNRRAVGEAVFDLELGMWKRQETRSEHRASVQGVPSADQATGRTITTIEMTLGEPPRLDPPANRVGL